MNRPTSPSQMQAHVQAWQQSGLAQKAYCRQHQLASHLLAYWIRRCRKQNAPQAKGFVVVSLSASATPVMELLTPGGARLLFYSRPEAAYLQELLS